jgi:hypothetical protein
MDLLLTTIHCPGCSELLALEVLHSPAGYYIGYFCSKCGPYDRISGYYKVEQAADTALTALRAALRVALGGLGDACISLPPAW